MVHFILLFLSISIFNCVLSMQDEFLFPTGAVQTQLVHPLEIKSEQGIKYKEKLLSANLGEISSNLKLEFQIYGRSERINDLNGPSNSLLMAINKYDRMLDAKAEVKQLLDMYKSASEYHAVKSLEQFRIDRTKIGAKINLIFNRAEAIANLYETFLNDAMKHVKMLKSIKDSERNSKKWIDLEIEDKAELIELVYGRLKTNTDLLTHCDELRSKVLNALELTIDAFKGLNGVSSMENFVRKCNNLCENQWEEVTKKDFGRDIKILSGRPLDVTSPMYVTVQINNNETEAFKSNIQSWKEKVYQEEFVEDSDSSTESVFNNALNRMAINSHEGKSGSKKIYIDKDEIDVSYIYHILEFACDEQCKTYGYDHQLNSIPKLNKVKEFLIAGKREYDY